MRKDLKLTASKSGRKIFGIIFNAYRLNSARYKMDNMKSHHAKAIKQLLEEAKVRYIFLPPYSPDLNPIENLWSKVKALLRKFKARTLETLSDAIQRAFRAVTPSDCSGWFRACGYSR